MDDLRASGHQNIFRDEEPGLTSIETQPPTAIGQRAILVETPNGNVLWDCITFLDDATIAGVMKRGGIDAIAISHPHFYSTSSTWSQSLDGVPVYIHAADRQWVQYPGPWIRFWEGETLEILPGMTLINTPGHFDGSQVLHWRDAADGKGVLLSGDSVKTALDRDWVSWMYSYVNYIPVSEQTIREIVRRLDPFEFERIYCLWNGHLTPINGSDAIRRSADRYIAFLRGERPAGTP